MSISNIDAILDDILMLHIIWIDIFSNNCISTAFSNPNSYFRDKSNNRRNLSRGIMDGVEEKIPRIRMQISRRVRYLGDNSGGKNVFDLPRQTEFCHSWFATRKKKNDTGLHTKDHCRSFYPRFVRLSFDRVDEFLFSFYCALYVNSMPIWLMLNFHKAILCRSPCRLIGH